IGRERTRQCPRFFQETWGAGARRPDLRLGRGGRGGRQRPRADDGSGGEGAAALDSVQIQIDGELVAHYIYSFKELDALKKGGVQRIYTGNVTTGEHQIEISVAGKLQGGADYSQSGSFAFRKGVEPKLVGVTL